MAPERDGARDRPRATRSFAPGPGPHGRGADGPGHGPRDAPDVRPRGLALLLLPGLCGCGLLERSAQEATEGAAQGMAAAEDEDLRRIGRELARGAGEGLTQAAQAAPWTGESLDRVSRRVGEGVGEGAAAALTRAVDPRARDPGEGIERLSALLAGAAARGGAEGVEAEMLLLVGLGGALVGVALGAVVSLLLRRRDPPREEGWLERGRGPYPRGSVR